MWRVILRIRTAKKKIWYGALTGAAVAVALMAIIGYFAYDILSDKQQSKIDSYEKQMADLKRSAAATNVAYTLSVAVEKGEAITESMVQKVYLADGAANEDLISIEDLNESNKYVFKAKTDLKANSLLTRALFYEDEDITNDIREGEYTFIEIPSNVTLDSYIDVRIQFPSGDEFIVLPKKKINNINGISLYMNVSEGDILTLSSAVVDAFVEGARIYAIPYVDEHMQEESIMTYPVKENIRDLIASSPNVLNKAKYYFETQNRLKLEANLLQVTEEDKALIENATIEYNSQLINMTEEELIELNEEAENKQQELIGGR
jgi:hypothetical protein